MKHFLVEQSNTEFYASARGPGLIGLCLHRFTSVTESLAAAIAIRLRIGLIAELSPVRHLPKRRRLKTVMQKPIYLAMRPIDSEHRLKRCFSLHVYSEVRA